MWPSVEWLSANIMIGRLRCSFNLAQAEPSRKRRHVEGAEATVTPRTVIGWAAAIRQRGMSVDAFQSETCSSPTIIWPTRTGWRHVPAQNGPTTDHYLQERDLRIAPSG